MKRRMAAWLLPITFTGAMVMGQAVQPVQRATRPPVAATPVKKPLLYEKLDVATLTKEQLAALNTIRRQTDQKLAKLLAEEQTEMTKLLDARQRQAVGDIDSMSDISDMDSLRMQMAMDRRSKMMEALSNILKKESDTSGAIIQNMK